MIMMMLNRVIKNRMMMKIVIKQYLSWLASECPSLGEHNLIIIMIMMMIMMMIDGDNIAFFHASSHL